MSSQLTWPSRSHGCGAVTEADVGASVTVCGWVDRNRDMGGVQFFDVRDHTGLLQVGPGWYGHAAVVEHGSHMPCMYTCIQTHGMGQFCMRLAVAPSSTPLPFGNGRCGGASRHGCRPDGIWVGPFGASAQQQRPRR